MIFTISIMVALAFLPLYSIVIVLKHCGPAYPSPYWIAFSATMKSESSFVSPHAPLSNKKELINGRRVNQR
jgi:hypothetical protein